MKSKKRLVAIGLGIIIIIGGLIMLRNLFTGGEEVKYKDEQDRMVKYIASNYENIEKVEFKNFLKNDITGYYSSLAIINGEYEVQFYMAGEGGQITLDYSIEFLKNTIKKSSKETTTKVKIDYAEEE